MSSKLVLLTSLLLICLSALFFLLHQGERTRPALPARYRTPPGQALQRGVAYLLAQQNPEGFWTSKQYGHLRKGGAITALTVCALTSLPEAMLREHAEAVERGFAHLASLQDDTGCIGDYDGTAEFPLYTMALYLQAAGAYRPPAWEAAAERVIRYLRLRQFAEQRVRADGGEETIELEDPRYGSWGLAGTGALADADRFDLSAVSFAIAGLRAAGASADDALLQKADIFVQRCQHLALPAGREEHIGGFFFCNYPPYKKSKAGMLDKDEHGIGFPLPYGSPTADGIRSLLLCGNAPGDERVASAMRWLREHHSLKEVPGFPADNTSTWALSLRYYYYCSFAQAMTEYLRATANFANDPGIAECRAWARKELAALAEHLAVLQADGGFWQNQHTLMWEDDIMIATGLAVIALSHCLREFDD